MRHKMIILGLVCISAMAQAQEKLSMAQAIDITLTHNYDIRIAQLDTEVSSNNATAGNAGLLPTIYAEGAYDYSSNNTDIELLPFTGESQENTVISGDGAVTETLNGAVKVEYTLFDGFGAYHRLDQLKSIDGFTQLESQYMIENAVMNTIMLYLNVATRQAGLRITEERLAISNERLQRAQSDFKFGAISKTIVLKAEVDVNNDEVALRKAQLDYNTARTELNAMMGRDLEVEYTVEEDLAFFSLQSEATLLQTLKANNTALQMARQGLSIAQYDLKSTQANRMPRLVVNGGYSYFNQENELGLLAEQSQNGWNVGVGLRFNLFDGHRLKKKVQNAKIKIQQQELQIAQAEQQVMAGFHNTYEAYLQSLEDLSIEEANLETFEQHFQRSQLDYKNGQISSTDLRTAQLDLSNAKLRIVKTTYLVKQKEIELLRFTGEMLKVK